MVNVMLYPCIFCIALSMDMIVLYVACLIVFVNCLVILLFNVMKVLSVGGGALLDRPCMVFQRVCVVHGGPVCI